MSDPYDQLVPGGGVTDPPVKPTKPQPQENDMNGKSMFRSKTFWINAITAVAGVLTTLGGSELIQDNPQVAGIAATVIGVVNVILRLVTKEPVSIIAK